MAEYVFDMPIPGKFCDAESELIVIASAGRHHPHSHCLLQPQAKRSSRASRPLLSTQVYENLNFIL